MNTLIPNPECDLVLVRTVPVTPERVFAAWTQPDLLMQWFTPAPWKTVACEIDVRPGGRFNTTMQSPEGDSYPNIGSIVAVEPGRHLAFTSTMAEDFRPLALGSGPGDLAFTAHITFEPADGGGTVYTVIAMHSTAEGRDRHAEMGFMDGWGAALDQLVALMGEK